MSEEKEEEEEEEEGVMKIKMKERVAGQAGGQDI